MKSSTDSGYYWAYRKGSPVPDVVYYHDGIVYEIVHTTYYPNHGPEGGVELLEVDGEDLSEGKWILGEKILPKGVDNLP